MDIEEFLELRKNTGDDRRRTHDEHSELGSRFIHEAGFEDEEWTLFSPSTCPDLHDLFGLAFEDRYKEYEAMTHTGEFNTSNVYRRRIYGGRCSRCCSRRAILGSRSRTCATSKPTAAHRRRTSSNLCTEITLNTSVDEIAVCNLGSVNLRQHVTRDGGLDREKLGRTVKTAVRMLDNVIDINYYAVPQAENSNMKHRPVGLGIVGFQDALYELGIPDQMTRFDSQMNRWRLFLTTRSKPRLSLHVSVVPILVSTGASGRKASCQLIRLKN